MINLADSSGLKMRFDQDTGRRHLSALPEGALCRGRAESKAEGKAEGEIAAKSSFLLSLLVNPLTATLPNKDIATLCGLSVAEVERILAKGSVTGSSPLFRRFARVSTPAPSAHA